MDNPHQGPDIRTPLHQACKCFGIHVGTACGCVKLSKAIWWLEVVAQYDIKSAVITDDDQH